MKIGDLVHCMDASVHSHNNVTKSCSFGHVVSFDLDKGTAEVLMFKIDGIERTPELRSWDTEDLLTQPQVDWFNAYTKKYPQGNQASYGPETCKGCLVHLEYPEPHREFVCGGCGRRSISRRLAHCRSGYVPKA